MTESYALVNALLVFAWAVFFGHGSLHRLTNWFSEIELTVHFPYGEFDRERENCNFRALVMEGAEFEWRDGPDLRIEILSIKWHYNP